MPLPYRAARRLLAVAAAALLTAGVTAALPRAQAREPEVARTVRLDVGGFMSPNLSYVATLPIDAPGVGGRVVKLGDQTRFYVTGVRGLSIFDVTDPEVPLLMGHLELPGWENEDVSVSEDGTTVLISGDDELYLWVIDVSIPALPVIKSFTPLIGGHTVTCVDDACDWVYGSSGHIIDLRDRTNPVLLPDRWTTITGLPSGHNLERDAAGIVWTDTTPIGALDVRDPARPRLITSGRAPKEAQTAYQHNTIRPDADRYRPRAVAERRAPGLRPGELLLGNGETNFTGQCDGGNGPFATYRITGLETGGKEGVELLEVFRPVTGTIADGNAAVNVLGCSGHWFTVHPDGRLVAASWYEHGTRLLDVDPATGHIVEVGVFQPVVGSASAAHWVDDTHIYVVDYARGIDILRYDPAAPAADPAFLEAAWLANLGVVSPLAEAERYLCRLGAGLVP